MSDQCKHCLVRGDIKACKETECRQHESWYAQEIQAELTHIRAALEEVVGALKRIVGACTRYLEEQAPSESEMYDPSYIGPLEQAHAALDHAERVEKGEEDNNENQT